MRAQEFIYTKVQSLVEKVPTIKASYEFMSDIETHIIEIVPIGEYENNDVYLQLENELYDEFVEQYFPSTILIVSEESINRVENPEWTIEGSNFGILTTWEDTLAIDGFNIEFDFFEESFNLLEGYDYREIPSFNNSGENNYALAA